MEMAINFILWFFGLIPKVINGLNYCLLKNPTLLKYICLLMSFATGTYITVLKAKEFGILATLTGLCIPAALLILYSNLYTKYKEKVKHLRSIAKDTELEIVFTEFEKDLFEKEMIKDKKFNDEITKKFIKENERKRIKSKKEIEAKLKKENEKNKNKFKTLDFGELGKIQTKLDINFEEEEDYQ